MRKYGRYLIAGLALGLLAFIAVTLLSDVEALAKFAQTFPWWVLVPVLALRTANWGFRLAKWHFYLRLVGVRKLRLWDSALVYFTGYPLAMSPGKAAEILKSFMIHHLDGTPIAVTLPVVASERLSDGMAVLFLIAVSILSLSAHEYWPVVVISLGAMVIGIVVLQVRPLCFCRW
jgi:hypothetical protein